MRKRLTKLVKNTKYALTGFYRYGVQSQYKHVLIIGGGSSIGNSLVSCFEDSWKVANIDFSNNQKAHKNILLDKKKDLSDDLDSIQNSLEQFSNQYEAIICASDFLSTSSIKDLSIFAEFQEASQVQAQNSLLAGHLASKYLLPNGLLLFTGGASPFLKNNSNTISYDVTKNMIHSLGLDLAELKDFSPDTTVLTILPQEKDFEENANPEKPVTEKEKRENQKTYHDNIGKIIRKWAEGKKRPVNGSYVLLKNVDNKIVPEFM